MAKKKAGAKSHHHFHQNPRAVVISVVGAFLALFVFSWVLGPNTTGFVGLNLNSVHIGEVAYGGTRLIISSQDGSYIPMNAARISGRIYGPGAVRVYLAQGEGRLLVYSNVEEKGLISPGKEPMGVVTRERRLDTSSLRSSNGAMPSLKLGIIENKELVSYPEAISDEFRLIRNACVDTCELHGSYDNSMYVFVFDIEPGTAFAVEDISFS